MKYKMVISYDGTKYGGWQIQPHTISIQALIQNALKIAIRQPISIISSGRTDAGVHALGQVAHFEMEKKCNLSTLLYSLNGILPLDIRIRSLNIAPNNFHARYSAKIKIYHYHLNLSPVQNPFKYLYSTHIHSKLNLSQIQEALPYFIGTHDFTSFSSTGCGSKNPVKTLYHLGMVSEPDGIYLEFKGTGFLYKMVRNIVGTLIEIGKNKRLPKDIPYILSQKNRCLAGPTASAKGLILNEVKY